MLKVNREEKWQCELRLPETVQMRAGRDGTLRETLADKNNEQTNRSHYIYYTAAALRVLGKEANVHHCHWARSHRRRDDFVYGEFVSFHVSF